MPRIVKITDMSQGHCWPPTFPIPNPNSTVYAQSLPIVTVGDQYYPHPGPCGSTPTHPVATIIGSENVFINNKPILRDGDPLSCGDIAKSIYGTVFCN